MQHEDRHDRIERPITKQRHQPCHPQQGKVSLPHHAHHGRRSRMYCTVVPLRGRGYATHSLKRKCGKHVDRASEREEQTRRTTWSPSTTRGVGYLSPPEEGRALYPSEPRAARRPARNGGDDRKRIRRAIVPIIPSQAPNEHRVTAHRIAPKIAQRPSRCSSNGSVDRTIPSRSHSLCQHSLVWEQVTSPGLAVGGRAGRDPPGPMTEEPVRAGTRGLAWPQPPRGCRPPPFRRACLGAAGRPAAPRRQARIAAPRGSGSPARRRRRAGSSVGSL